MGLLILKNHERKINIIYTFLFNKFICTRKNVHNKAADFEVGLSPKYQVMLGLYPLILLLIVFLHL